MNSITPQRASTEAKLLDECLELEARLYGKRLELAMAAGSRENAVFWRECMEKAVRARRDLALGHAESRGEDFFVAAGDFDGDGELML
jgi:hypothetical protein